MRDANKYSWWEQYERPPVALRVPRERAAINWPFVLVVCLVPIVWGAVIWWLY